VANRLDRKVFPFRLGKAYRDLRIFSFLRDFKFAFGKLHIAGKGGGGWYFFKNMRKPGNVHFRFRFISDDFRGPLDKFTREKFFLSTHSEFLGLFPLIYAYSK